MNKNIKIAKQLIKLAKQLISSEFNFLTVEDNKCNPENIFIVSKSDVFAYQLTEDDVKKIIDLESREGKYDKEYKTAGNWICTAKVGKDAGEFWIVKDNKFSKNYQTKTADNEVLKKEVCGIDIEFKHYLASENKTFECFRLPSDAPKTMYLGGNKFVPGDYVFIENNECDIWARSDTFMQQQYHLVKEKRNNPNKKIKEQFEQLLSGEKD